MMPKSQQLCKLNQQKIQRSGMNQEGGCLALLLVIVDANQKLSKEDKCFNAC